MIAGINLCLFLVLFLYSGIRYQGKESLKKGKKNLLYPLTLWIYEKILFLTQKSGKKERMLPNMSKQEFLEMRKNQWMNAIYKIVIVFVITNGMALMVEVIEHKKQQEIVIERNAYGEGEAYYDFTVYEKKEEIGSIIIEVPEATYSESELMEKYREAKEYVESCFLGENEKEEVVKGNLCFTETVPENDIEISFRSENSELVTNCK